MYRPMSYPRRILTAPQPMRLGAAAAPVRVAPSLGAAQSAAIQKRMALLDSQNSFFNPDISRQFPPTDARQFIVTPLVGTVAQPFVAYPAPGAAPVVVIQYVVQPGLVAIINKLAVVHVGGNPPDGTGNVIWRVRKNFAGEKGLNNLTSQVGTYAMPNDVVIVGLESDIIDVTVEVPAGQPAMPVPQGTAARFHGYTLPILRSTDVSGKGGV